VTHPTQTEAPRYTPSVTSSGETPEEIEIEVHIAPEHMAGVWANFARVSHSPYEFTLDFVRVDFSDPKAPQGIVVARVSVSPLFISQLMEALDTNWKRYAAKALPKEAQDFVTPTEPEPGDTPEG
jgi:hypothetical protein